MQSRDHDRLDLLEAHTIVQVVKWATQR